MLHSILELESLFFPPFADEGLGTLALRSVLGYRVISPQRRLSPGGWDSGSENGRCFPATFGLCHLTDNLPCFSEALKCFSCGRFVSLSLAKMTKEEIWLWRYSREDVKTGHYPLTHPCFLVSSPKWSFGTLDCCFFRIVHPPVLDKFFHLLTIGSLCCELNILTFMVDILSPVHTVPYCFILCLHFILFKNLLLK